MAEQKKISEALALARSMFNRGYAERIKLREMGYSVLLDGRVFHKGQFIGSV